MQESKSENFDRASVAAYKSEPIENLAWEAYNADALNMIRADNNRSRELQSRDLRDLQIVGDWAAKREPSGDAPAPRDRANAKATGDDTINQLGDRFKDRMNLPPLGSSDRSTFEKLNTENRTSQRDSSGVSDKERRKLVEGILEKLVEPRLDASEAPPLEKKPLTKEEKSARAFELMLKLVEGEDKNVEETNKFVAKAATAIKDGKFDELSKVIKELAKNGDDDQLGAFQKKLSKELGGAYVSVKADGSYDLHFSKDFDPHASDKPYSVKTVKFDKDGKASSAEVTKYKAGAGKDETEEIDAKETLKELQQVIEKSKKK